MIELQIDTTEIFLNDYELGKGKIIISDVYNGSYSYYWGAMGGTLGEFITRINKEYFADKLCSNDNVFDPKGSLTNIRKAVRESYDLPWYIYMEAQKELRYELRKLEDCRNEDDFVHSVKKIVDYLPTDGLGTYEAKDYRDIVESLFSEPWCYIAYKPSESYKFLTKLHGRIVKNLLETGIVRSKLIPVV